MLAMTRRALAVGLFTVALAACKVVPDTRPGPAPAPTPAPGPSGDVLPTDTGRHRVALLVPLSGDNAAVVSLLKRVAKSLHVTWAGGEREFVVGLEG